MCSLRLAAPQFDHHCPVSCHAAQRTAALCVLSAGVDLLLTFLVVVCVCVQWVCNCIGLRNYRYFVGFVLSVTLTTTYVFLCSIILLSQAVRATSFQVALGDHPLAACLTM